MRGSVGVSKGEAHMVGAYRFSVENGYELKNTIDRNRCPGCDRGSLYQLASRDEVKRLHPINKTIAARGKGVLVCTSYCKSSPRWGRRMKKPAVNRALVKSGP